MTGHRSKLVQAAAALALLVMSSWLWLPLGASSTHASSIHVLAGSPTAVCPTPGNNACIITQIPTVVLTLSGKDQTIPYVLTFTLNAAFSSWYVTISSTQFTAGSHTLPINASNVTAVASASACGGNVCPQSAITLPVGVPVPPTPPATFYDNTAGGSHGMGTFTILATINVLVPANSFAGTYTCTVTISFQSGP